MKRSLRGPDGGRPWPFTLMGMGSHCRVLRGKGTELSCGFKGPGKKEETFERPWQ